MTSRRNGFRQTRPGMVRIVLWASRYAFRRWPGLLAILGTMMLNIGLSVLQPWPMKVLVDNVLGGKPLRPSIAHLVHLLPSSSNREDLLTWAVAATVILFVVGWAIGVLSSFASIAFGQGMIYDLATDLFDHMQRLSLSFHVRHPVGDSVRRVTSDSTCVSTIVTGTFLPTLGALFTLATMVGIMWKLDRELLFFALLVVPFMAVVAKHFAAPMAARSYEQQEIQGQQFTIIEQTLSAIPVIKAFTREAHVDARFQGNTRDILSAILASTRVQQRFTISLGIVTSVGTAGIIWMGAQHVLNGTLTVGTLLVFLSYLGSLYGPVHSLVHTSSTVQGAAGSVRRVFQVLDTRPEVVEEEGARELGAVRGAVRLEDVTFGYEPGRPVLQGITLEAQPGETIAIVGPTGVGKSTLVSLIPRFYDPWDGRVLIDGQDIRHVGLRSLREQVALVLQEPFLFPVTLAENIAYGRPDAGREAIEAAARAANAHAFIERLPQGYDTIVGERGATLSGGERQRISIARALLKDAPILILDEPTSALDAETESLLLEALERLMAGRTTFIIAHRLSTIRGADRIAVLHEGRIAELATHETLLAHGGIYARLHALQFDKAS